MRLYRLDVECPSCDHRPLLRAYQALRDAVAAMGAKVRLLDVRCATVGCGKSYPITARAVHDSREVRVATLDGETLVEVPDTLPADPRLTDRQARVCDLVLDGLTDRRIAAALGVSKPTVRKAIAAAAAALCSVDSQSCRSLPRGTIVAYYRERTRAVVQAEPFKSAA